MAISKELIQQLREHMKMFTDVNSISVTFKTEDAKALLDEIERLQGENEELQAKIGTFRWEAVKKWAYKTYGLKDKEEDAPTALSNSHGKEV